MSAEALRPSDDDISARRLSPTRRLHLADNPINSLAIDGDYVVARNIHCALSRYRILAPRISKQTIDPPNRNAIVESRNSWLDNEDYGHPNTGMTNPPTCSRGWFRRPCIKILESTSLIEAVVSSGARGLNG